jgi:hypothetical protein
MAPTGSLELYQSLMKWLRTFPTTKDEADVTDGVDMAKVNQKIENSRKRKKGEKDCSMGVTGGEKTVNEGNR